MKKIHFLISPLHIPLPVVMKDFERPPITENTLKNVLQHFSNLLRFEKSGGTDQEGGCTEMAYGDFHGNRSEGGKKKLQLNLFTTSA